MKHIIGMALLVLFVSGVNSKLVADEGLAVSDPWVPEAPPVASVLAGYLTFENKTDKPVKLIAAESAQFDKVEFHLSVEKGGMARMVKQDNLLVVPGQPFSLRPGGYHLMLIGPKQAYEVGDKIEVTFKSESGTMLPVTFVVRKPGSGDDTQHHHHHHH